MQNLEKLNHNLMNIEVQLETVIILEKNFRNAVEDYKKGTDNSVKKRLIIILIILIALFLLAFIL